MQQGFTGTVVAYVDGACFPNPGPGGWGVVFDTDTSIYEASGAAHHATNNQMELAGAVNALRMCAPDADVTIVSDSQYVVNGASSWMLGWKRRGWRLRNGAQVKNVEWWKEIDMEAQHRPRVGWKWVRGHSGVWFNERADILATQAAAEAARGNVGRLVIV